MLLVDQQHPPQNRSRKQAPNPPQRPKAKGLRLRRKNQPLRRLPRLSQQTRTRKQWKQRKRRKTPPLEDEAEEDDGDEDCDVIPKKKPATNSTKKTKVLKRPAAAAKPKPFTVYKYRYPTGKYGFKVNGKEVMGVTRLNIIPCHKNSVEMFVILIYQDHARPISAQVKPVSGLNDEVMGDHCGSSDF